MASLEKRAGRYSIVFRFRGRKFSRAIKTTDEEEAETRRMNLEQMIRLVEGGTIKLPPDVDTAEFLLSGGKAKRREERRDAVTLATLVEEFFSSLTKGSLEKSTLDGMMTHKRHLLRVLDGKMDADNLTLTTLDAYAKKRLREKINGRKAGPSTIKKELVTLRRLWGWGQRRGKVTAKFPAIKDVELPKTKELPPFQTWAEIEQQIEGRICRRSSIRSRNRRLGSRSKE